MVFCVGLWLVYYFCCGWFLCIMFIVYYLYLDFVLFVVSVVRGLWVYVLRLHCDLTWWCLLEVIYVMVGDC